MKNTNLRWWIAICLIGLGLVGYLIYARRNTFAPKPDPAKTAKKEEVGEKTSDESERGRSPIGEAIDAAEEEAERIEEQIEELDKSDEAVEVEPEPEPQPEPEPPPRLTDKEREQLLAETIRLLGIIENFPADEQALRGLIDKLRRGNLDDDTRTKLDTDQHISDVYWALLGPTAPNDLTVVRYDAEDVLRHQAPLEEIRTELGNTLNPTTTPYDEFSRRLRSIDRQLASAVTSVGDALTLLRYADTVLAGERPEPPSQFHRYSGVRLTAWRGYLARVSSYKQSDLYRSPDVLKIFYPVLQPPEGRNKPNAAGLNVRAITLHELPATFELHGSLQPHGTFYAIVSGYARRWVAGRAIADKMLADVVELRRKHGDKIPPRMQVLWERCVRSIGPEWFLTEEDKTVLRNGVREGRTDANGIKLTSNVDFIIGQKPRHRDFDKIQWVDKPGDPPDPGAVPSRLDVAGFSKDELYGRASSLKPIDTRPILQAKEEERRAKVASQRFPVGAKLIITLSGTGLNETWTYTITKHLSDESFWAERDGTETHFSVKTNKLFAWYDPKARANCYGPITADSITGQYSAPSGGGTYSITIRRPDEPRPPPELFVVGATLTISPVGKPDRYTYTIINRRRGDSFLTRRGEDTFTFTFDEARGLYWKDSQFANAVFQIPKPHAGPTLSGTVTGPGRPDSGFTMTVDPPDK